MTKRVPFILWVSIYIFLFVSIFAYSHLNWKEDLFLFILICLYIIGCIFKRVTPGVWNNFLIFFLIFLLSQFYINNFHPENIEWWFASIPGWLTLFIAFLGSLSLVSYQRIRVDSQPTQASNQTFNDLITKATPGIILVSLAMFFIFVLNIDEISPQTKLIPDYSIYIIIPFGFVLFYSLNFSLKCLPFKKMGKYLQSTVFGVLIFLVGIGAIKIYIVYTANHNALHLRSNEKFWHDLLELNKTPKIKSIDIRAMNELGKISMEKGNFREAANYYKKILSDRAFNFEANLGLAKIAYKQKEWERAREAYKGAIYLNPRERNFYLPYIHACLKAGKIDKALEFIRNLGEPYPITLKETEDYLNIGEGFFRKKQIKEAITYLRRATEFMPYNYRAYFLLGKAYMESRQYTDGCEALEKAVRLNTKDAEGYHYLGIGYENIHQKDKAIEAYERGALIDNKNIKRFYDLKRLYTKMGLNNKALKIDDLIESIATKVIEQADWKGKAGENIYQNGDMPWTGTVSAPVFLKEGNAKFILQAMGTPAKSIWPHMVVKLNDEIVGEVDVTSEKLNDYEFKKTVNPGKYNLSISFTNDEGTLDKNGKLIEDRNLFVRRCRIIYEE
jgi:tetratricopeptide (TPR) repeat protein